VLAPRLLRLRPAVNLKVAYAPPPPREPSETTRELIYKYTGSQKVRLFVGVLFFGLGAPMFACMVSRVAELNVGVVAVGCFAVIFPVVGALVGIGAVVSNRREKRAYRDGLPIDGKVVRSEQDTSTAINEKHPWIIRWEFSVDGKPYEGELTHMNHALLQAFKVGSAVTVLYLREDPKVNTLYLD
jgi:hypothetical protein